MRIAILTISTGKYDIFVPDLIQSCEKKFLPGCEKKYFVFTDSEKIQSSGNIIKIEQRKLGWPYDTMMRFHMFNSIKSDLEKFDYIFFMNANMLVSSVVGRMILEMEGTCGIIATLHPGYYGVFKHNYPLERNSKSVFFIDYEKETNYYQGCFNGGRSRDFIEMSGILSQMINQDLSNKIIPIWHDETALNWYLNTKNPKILDPTFSYPEPAKTLDQYRNLINIYGDPKIIQKNKDNFGGAQNLRKFKNEKIVNENNKSKKLHLPNSGKDRAQ